MVWRRFAKDALVPYSMKEIYRNRQVKVIVDKGMSITLGYHFTGDHVQHLIWKYMQEVEDRILYIIRRLYDERSEKSNEGRYSRNFN